MLLAPFRAAAEVACHPFKVHNRVNLPPPPPAAVPLPTHWAEKAMAGEIGRVKTQEDFPALYAKWLAEHPGSLSEQERFDWLRCLLYYVKMDASGDGIPDWSAILDRQPARVLFPEDPDQNGDGVPNVLDPDPLRKHGKIHLAQGEIPPHLKIDRKKRPEAATLQKELFEMSGVLAIDHTDDHAPAVLRELLGLLKTGFPRLEGVRYVYAFAGHDPLRNIAAFHREARALSIGGVLAYGQERLPRKSRIELALALAHELGHAVLFEKLTASELASAAAKYAGWHAALPLARASSLYSSLFFQPFPASPLKNMVSKYAMKNQHEWFAESFAAATVEKLGEKGALGADWQKLTRTSNARGMTADFRSWLETFLR